MKIDQKNRLPKKGEKMKKRIVPICAVICALAFFATSQFYSKPAVKTSEAALKEKYASLKKFSEIKTMYEMADKMSMDDINEGIKVFKTMIEKYQKLSMEIPAYYSEIVDFLIEAAKAHVAVFEEIKMVIETRQKPAQS